MGNWYTVYKRIKGHVYAYRQKSQRYGAQVRSISEYLGRADHLAGAIGKTAKGLTLQRHRLFEVVTLPEKSVISVWNKGQLTLLHPDDMLPQSRDALLAYQSNKFIKINQALRGEHPMTSELKRKILGLRAALYDPRAYLTENVNLYRAGLIRIDEMRVGAVFKQPSIVSFSVVADLAVDWLGSYTQQQRYYQKCLIEIIAEKGDNRYVSMQGITGGAAEAEVISSGATFEILSIEKRGKTFHVRAGRKGQIV